jgi:uroporphyrinogen decarboxylase
MTPRERIQAAIAHQTPDRIPIDFGGTPETGIAGVAYQALRKHLGINGTPPRIFDVNQQLAVVEGPARQRAGDDCLLLTVGCKEWRSWTLPDGSPCEVPARWQPVRGTDGSDTVMGPTGAPLVRRLPGAFWFSPAGPLAPGLDSIADIPKFMPYIRILDRPPYLDESLEDLAQRARTLHRETDYALIGHFGGHIFAACQLLRGMNNFMCDLIADNKFARALLDAIADQHITEFEHYIAALGPYVQVVAVADDLGSQRGPQMSVELFREIVRPPMERLYQFIKKHSDAKLFLHSCGSVAALIPDLVEMGVDILNPVQVSAADMDTKRLKREFGRDLVFWGGGCDTQHILPFGTPQQVRDEVRRRIEDLGPDGFVFAQVHNIQPGVPPENMLAMWDAARDFGAS